jgi:HK97 family phage major capsid protein
MDLLHGYMLLRSAKSFHGVSQTYANALAHRVQRAGLTAIKADELSYSTQTGFGDEWVPDLWSAQIWKKARLENIILPLFQSVEMPSNPFELPIEGADPTVYFVPETANESQLALDTSSNPIPDSKVGSGKVQLAAKKLALRVGFSAELVEDSIVPVLNIYREQAVRAIADSIDYVLLNGDTETAATGNINSDNGAPASTARYLAFNGLRKLPLVTNTANRVDAANVAPTLALLRQARFTMAAKYAARPSDLAWIVDGGTYAKFLAIAEFLTMDKAGPMATALTGQIGFADGAPVLVSAEMPLTEADGKVGGGTNDRGTAVCVYRPGWFVGYRRRIAVSVDYLPYYDSYQLTATVRLAFANFDNDVSSALFNLAV